MDFREQFKNLSLKHLGKEREVGALERRMVHTLSQSPPRYHDTILEQAVLNVKLCILLKGRPDLSDIEYVNMVSQSFAFLDSAFKSASVPK